MTCSFFLPAMITCAPCLSAALACGLLASSSLAAVHELDDAASPFRVSFNDAGAFLTVTGKSDGWVWRNPDSNGGNTVTSVTNVARPDARTLTATVLISGSSYALTLELATAPAELRVTLGGDPAASLNGVVWPWPFFGSDGLGQCVLPFDSGYLVPTTATTFTLPGGQRGMEWFGGTDSANQRAWVALVDTPDDYEMKARNACVMNGVTLLGAAPNWRGSNGNAALAANKLSYARRLRFRFLSTGGHVAMAKVFREDARGRGLLKTLQEKGAETGAPDVRKFIGSPICYLWGDGRGTALLDEMKAAGIEKAHIQVSVNHVDTQKNFPATGLADRAWFDAIRARGYTGGFYDIYAGARGSGQGGSAYDGFYYLWPSNAYAEWAYFDSTQTPAGNTLQHSINNSKAALFATETRMPAHISRFGLDACFFDVVCAVDLTEDYDNRYGHFGTRSADRTGRVSLLNSAFSQPTKRLLTGTEQGRSWAVPVCHWFEGKFWIGSQSAGLPDGSWNDGSANVYPEIMVDVFDPSATGKLGGLFNDGYSAPLWDLVFHDCVVTTVHWHRPHNKYVYGWDHQDRWAMLRGQAALLNMTYSGVQGLSSRQPNTLTDTSGRSWTTRWSVMRDRFVQTYNDVCTWHGKVGLLEMINHARLTTDRSVQMSEFSGDGGISGQGIVVNFGVWDGGTGLTGASWSGSLRGQALSVPVADQRQYAWDARPQNLRAERTDATHCRVTFAGLGGYTYRIERSGDLRAWTDLGAPAGPVSAQELVDPVPAGSTTLFYRVVTTSP